MEHSDKFYEISRAISDKKQYPEDKIGNTKLTLLADKIKLASSEERAAYVVEIRKFVGMCDKISAEKIRKLIDLVTMAELKYEEYIQSFENTFYSCDRVKELSLIKRAEIFCFLGEFGFGFSKSFILSETEIRKRYPWYWIDAVMHSHRRLAINEVKRWLKDKKDVTPVLMRLAAWKDLYKTKKSFQAMLTGVLKEVTLTEKDAETIQSFLKTI